MVELNNLQSHPTVERYSHRKIVFHSIQYKNGCLATSDLFHMFTRSIKFYIFYYQVLKSTDV